MKKILVIAVICLFFLEFTNGQTTNSCNMLMQIFKNDTIKDRFMLDKYPNKPIIFVDVNHFFDGCKIPPYKRRKVKYVHDSSYLKQKSIEYIIIHNLLNKNNRYYIVIESKATGAYGDIEFVETKNGRKISKIKMGYF